MLVERAIKKQIKSKLYKGKLILIYGPRRVGKTTLAKEILREEGGTKYLLCDEPDIRAALTNKTSTELKNFIGNQKIVVIDEAQRVENIGLTLKLLVDNFPEMQIIATGSSSFDLSNKINEPLTGRNFEFHLFPFSIGEIRSVIGDMEIKRRLPEFLNYGLYPEVFLANSYEEKREILKKLATDQLYKDVLMYQEIRKPQVLEGLLSYIALSIKNELNFTKLGVQVEISKETAMSYTRLLEQAFVIFKLTPFFTNKFKEINQLNKFYFFDNGIRNGLLDTFNLEIDKRQDLGGLWENFVLAELVKKKYYENSSGKYFFWRTKNGQELDLVEDFVGYTNGYEIKLSKNLVEKEEAIRTNLSNLKSLAVINKSNFLDFL